VSQKYPGGIISKTPPVTTGPNAEGEGGSAPGIWTLEQALELQKQNLWPKPPIPRELYVAGSNNNGQLGLGNTIGRSSPVQVGALTNWSNVSLSQSHVLAVNNEGALYAWGENNNGQLGLGNTVNRSSPVQVGALTNWSGAAAGGVAQAGIGVQSAAIKTDGTLWSWGANNDGRLGLNDTVYRSSPVQVGALTNWSQISVGGGNGRHVLSIKTDGTMWSWGRNHYGQLGLGNTINRSSPVQIGALTNWAAISAGDQMSLAIKSDGTMWVWGENGFGALGLNDSANRSSPVQVGALTNWVNASSGARQTGAINLSGALWTWGVGSYGGLGLGNTVNRSSPVQVGALTNWAKISVGSQWMAAIKTDGTLWGWGNNSNGQIGLNDTDSRSSPVQIGALTSWVRLFQGNSSRSLAALKTT
jgi:alpha-tubulin suppressor-like RCC1 family protein